VVAEVSLAPGHVDPRLEHWHQHLAHAGLSYPTMQVRAEKAADAAPGTQVTLPVESAREADVEVRSVGARQATVAVGLPGAATPALQSILCGRSALFELGPSGSDARTQLWLVVDLRCAR
jgi:hypothetical protein